MMKHIFGYILISLLYSGLYAQEPVFRLQDLDKKWQEYDQLKGSKLTVIDFWATWCQPCVRAIPLLSDMSEEFADQGVNFIGISIDGPRNQAKVKPFIQSMGVSYPILRDVNSELMTELGITAVPTLLVYNHEGELIYYHEGFRPGDEETIRNHIQSELEK
jgi:thiol-disulfide isomerase/thioredoxin